MMSIENELLKAIKRDDNRTADMKLSSELDKTNIDEGIICNLRSGNDENWPLNHLNQLIVLDPETGIERQISKDMSYLYEALDFQRIFGDLMIRRHEIIEDPSKDRWFETRLIKYSEQSIETIKELSNKIVYKGSFSEYGENFAVILSSVYQDKDSGALVPDNPRLVIIGPDGDELDIAEATSFGWSGRRILWFKDRRIHMANSDGTDAHQILDANIYVNEMYNHGGKNITVKADTIEDNHVSFNDIYEYNLDKRMAKLEKTGERESKDMSSEILNRGETGRIDDSIFKGDARRYLEIMFKWRDMNPDHIVGEPIFSPYFDKICYLREDNVLFFYDSKTDEIKEMHTMYPAYPVGWR